MKCTFEDQAICARCLVGGHECVVLGRKPRSPGLREILRKQIREKDAKIDELLSQLNPTPSLATPLSIVPSRLSLTDSQRNMYRDVLVWFEKSQSGAKSDVKSRIDVSFLEDSEDEFDSDDEMSLGDENQASSSKALSRSFGSLPGSSAPAGLLVNAVLDIQRQLTPGKDAEMEEDSEDMRIERGIGSKTYFQPGPSANLDLRRLIIERQAAPDILLSGLVTYDDVGKLFDLYFKWINPFIPVLDENIHTPAAVLGRCPFLFTVVCALASRYYNEKPEMYGLAMHLAKATAANAFLDGWKTIEMCQAYILLGAYTPPARRWEEDRYWFYTGIAFRLGIELNLNRIPAEKPTDERNQRELLNRLRTWIICYIMDRCICINLGKPFMVPEDDVIRNVAARFLGYNHQHPNDPYLVSLVELLRIITRFSEMYSPIMESRPNISFLASAHKVIGDELTAWLTTATERCERDPVRDARHTMQMALMQSVYQYCRLVTFSAGLQQVMKAGTLNDDTIFFAGCLHAASAVLNLMMDGLMPTGLMENSPEQVYALTAFATVVLLKCLRPEFSSKIDRIQEDRIVALVKRLLQTLNDADQREDSEEKDQHTTKRYAGFLQHILVPHIAELEARRKKSSISTFSQIQGPEEEQEGGGGKSSSSSGSSLSALPQVKVTPPSEQPLLPMDFEFVPESNSWDSMFSNQDATPIPPILGFSDSDYLASMMSFTDQSWYNSS
ncbi:hypothetical protein C8Q75DRAFT_816566 [Abortiporus biennis]|nr:hypothetical protein C8Q75DRAFT_816566 [Abortiporus biennis]